MEKDIKDPSKRRFLGLVARTASGLAVSAFIPPLIRPNFTPDHLPPTDTPPTTAPAKASGNIEQEMIEEGKGMGGLDTLGYRLSKPWAGPDDTVYIAYQRAILQRNPDGKIGLRKILNQIPQHMDSDLASGKLGIIVPPRQELNNPDYQTLPNAILDEIRRLVQKHIDPGRPTSLLEDYGEFSVMRFESIAMQLWKNGTLTKVLIGDALQRFGEIIPLQAILAIPQRDDQSDPLECTLTATSWRGDAGWYDNEHCLGCREDRLMANGRPLGNAPTIAFMRAPLGSWVKIVNRRNGKWKVAEITDRGGFEQQPLNRIADLTPPVRDAIEAEDITPVEITLLNC